MTPDATAAAVEGPVLSADIDPRTAGEDLARVVLALVEFVRRLLELQAMRRLEAGTLTAAEEEQVGDALMKAGEAVRLVAARFGLEEADLTLDLGPLGRLL
jgi:hypothetical protein